MEVDRSYLTEVDVYGKLLQMHLKMIDVSIKICREEVLI